VQQVRVVLRALSQLAQGVSAPRISSVIPLTAQAIRKVGHRYQQGGLQRALYEKEGPGAAEVLEDRPYTVNSRSVNTGIRKASAKVVQRCSPSSMVTPYRESGRVSVVSVSLPVFPPYTDELEA
jgi:hypothetical protein